MDARVPNHGQWYKNPIRAYTSHYLALVQERDRANKPRPRWRIRAFCPQSTTFPMPRTSIFCRITGNFSEPLYYQEANIMMRDGGFRAGRSYRRHLSIFIRSEERRVGKECNLLESMKDYYKWFIQQELILKYI